MPDAPHRRSSDKALGTRLTVVEVEQRNFLRRFDEHLLSSGELHRDAQRLISELDKRADRQDILMARIFAGLVLAGFLGQLFAPLIQRFLSIPS